MLLWIYKDFLEGVLIKVSKVQIKSMIAEVAIPVTEAPVEHKKDQWEPYTDNYGFG